MESHTFSKIWRHEDMLTPNSGGVFVRFEGLNRFKKLVGKQVEVKITAEDVKMNQEEAIAAIRKVVAKYRAYSVNTVAAFHDIVAILDNTPNPCEAYRSVSPSYLGAHTCGAK